jgi:hypothetical protein
MPSLTETAHYTRKILKYGTIALIILVVFRFSLNLFKKTWQRLRPPPPPAPTIAFGKLPALLLPESQAGGKQLSFRLETIGGGLPSLPETGKVYFMPKTRPNLLALDRAKQQARKMGFTTQPEAIGETRYRWLTQTAPVTTLEMDINTGNFSLRYNYENDPEVLAEKKLPNNQEAAQEAKNFLTSNGLLQADLENGTAEFEYLRFSAPDLTPVASLSEADFIRVNLFRANLDNLPILPPNPKKSSISFLFSGARAAGKRIAEISYTYFLIETETFATYPLRSVTHAWNQLQANEGFVVYLGQNETNQITIRQVYLAYFDSTEPQLYLQPIYVFKGDRNFYAYVPAIDPEWQE